MRFHVNFTYGYFMQKQGGSKIVCGFSNKYFLFGKNQDMKILIKEDYFLYVERWIWQMENIVRGTMEKILSALPDYSLP